MLSLQPAINCVFNLFCVLFIFRDYIIPSRNPEQCPHVVSLLSESFNAHVRCGSAMALGVSCAGTGNKVRNLGLWIYVGVSNFGYHASPTHSSSLIHPQVESLFIFSFSSPPPPLPPTLIVGGTGCHRSFTERFSTICSTGECMTRASNKKTAFKNNLHGVCVCEMPCQSSLYVPI